MTRRPVVRLASCAHPHVTVEKLLATELGLGTHGKHPSVRAVYLVREAQALWDRRVQQRGEQSGFVARSLQGPVCFNKVACKHGVINECCTVINAVSWRNS